MSYNQHLRDRIVITKKPHRCLPCWTTWPAGTTMVYSVGVYEGDFQTSYQCPCCTAFMKLNGWEYWEDGIGPGEIFEHPDYKAFREKYKHEQATGSGSVESNA